MKYLFHNFLYTLRNYKVSSLLNVCGMAVAFAAFYIIVTQVSYDLGYNRRLEDAGRLFVMTTSSEYNQGKYNPWLDRPIGEKLVAESPLVECGGTFETWAGKGELCWTRQNGTAKKLHLSLDNYSAGALKAFGFEAESGSLEDLERPGTFAVQEYVAKQYGLSVGDKVSWSDPEGERGAGELVAIFRDFQSNSDLHESRAIKNIGDSRIDDVNEWSYNYVVKLRDPADREEFETYSKGVISEFVRELYGADGSDEEQMQEINEISERLAIKLIPFDELFYSKLLDSPTGKSGNRTADMTFLAVAILTILIALINFVNFFFAMVPARLRSVNTYKIFGVSRAALVGNFIFESAGLVILSLAFSALIVKIFIASPLSGILAAPAGFGGNGGVIVLTVLVALAAGIAGSIYPALYITSFQPALALKGSFSGSAAGRRLRNVLIGFQYVISIALIICAMFVKRQYAYVMKYDMGFNKENLLSGEMPYGLCWLGDQNQAFENRLRSNPAIVDITWADGEIVKLNRMGWGRDYKGKNINFQCYPVAPNFLRFMGIDIVEGRDFLASDDYAENGSMIFNEQAKKHFDIDFETPAPGHQDNAVVVGICRDFNFKPLQYGKSDFAFYVFGKHSWRSGLQRMYVRTAAGANPQEVIEFIRNTVQEMRPDLDPETYGIDFFDRELGEQYRQESKLSSMISIFTAIAIVISLMGVFGLVLFDTQHRSREIAIRRVQGATVRDILTMFNAKYIRIVIVSFVVAAPLCLWIVSKYFGNFAYHTDMAWWVFALALAAVMAITVIIVTLRSLSAATTNPAEKLKSE